MKKATFLFLTVFMFAILPSQTYEIEFAGSGDATVVDSVKIENLHQGTTLTLKNGEVLTLNVIAQSGIFDNTTNTRKVSVFPNPMTMLAEVEFYLDNSSNVLVSVFDLSGRTIVQSSKILQPGVHKYMLSGLKSGIYMVGIIGQNFFYSAKVISQGNLSTDAELVYLSSEKVSVKQIQNETYRLKSASSDIDLECNEGDRLKITGMSGNLSTVLTWVPCSDSTITFDFIECKDADDNYYPVVTIGTQTWMAKNLGTTRYNDSTAIPLVTDSTAWSLLTTPAYCWYNNDSLTYKNTYGALYNWFTVDSASNGGKNVCPSGWHVANNDDWLALATYAGGSGIGGGKLKETGITHWNSPNTGASDETAFSALGSGWRYKIGRFADLGVYECLWSATEANTGNGFYLEMDYNNTFFNRYDWYKPCGFSVRCVKD